jgi:hypothetical protein
VRASAARAGLGIGVALSSCGGGGGSGADEGSTAAASTGASASSPASDGDDASDAADDVASQDASDDAPATAATSASVDDTSSSDDTGVAPPSGAIRFARNAARDHDYGHDIALPPSFGVAEFTFEAWIVPDGSFPVGPTDGGEAQLENWSDADLEPYSSSDWWYSGNFLLDGHNNASFSAGTFSLQFYGGGRVRWLFGDGASDVPGNVWSVGAYPADEAIPLIDDAPHLVTCVRRADGDGATLELWIDGVLVDDESTPVLTDMQSSWWSDWSTVLLGQEGWFWGAEKQAAIGELSQYEDYKGLLAELRFWDVARSESDIAASPSETLQGDEPGLVGLVHFDEGAGTQACDALDPTRCMQLYRMQRPFWIE